MINCTHACIDSVLNKINIICSSDNDLPGLSSLSGPPIIIANQ